VSNIESKSDDAPHIKKVLKLQSSHQQ